MPTRLFFPETEAAAVSPAIDTGAGNWDGHVNTVRRRLRQTADSSALSTVAYTPDAADHAGDLNAHHRQCVGDVMPAQTFAAQTVKAQLQILEAHANNNLFLALRILVVSEDGATVLGTLLALTRDNTEPGTALINRQFSATTSEVTTTQPGRLVVEVGLGGSPGGGGGVQGHNGSIRWGGSASSGDLPEDDTQTGTTYRPWIEFANVLEFGYAVNAAAGSYGVTGQAADTLAARVLDLAVGVLALSGQAADLARGFPLDASAGVYAIAGAAAEFPVTRVLDAAGGSYGLAGAAAELLAARVLDLGPGTYLATGQAAELLRGFPLDAGPGAYAISGAAADVLFTRVLDLGAGAYLVTGSAAGLLGTRVVAADAGMYTLAGAVATLLAARTAEASPGAYLVSGADGSLLVGRVIVASPGAYLLVGADATLVYTGGQQAYQMAADPGTYALSGAVAVLIFPERLAGPMRVTVDTHTERSGDDGHTRADVTNTRTGI